MYAADSAHRNASLQEKLRRLSALRGGPAIDLTIRPAYYQLLHRLGDPHRHLPPVIHVAGTNGKGSTIALMRAMLAAGGLRVHVYTSPHLLRFNERIVLAGCEITDAALEELLDEVTALNGDLPQTFFEITTALAFAAFARAPADVLLLETGLGGRLDSTNVVEQPRVTIIAPIGHDHHEFLGDTLPLIAAEKAGILKRGTPCIVAAQEDAAAASVIAARAAELGCPLQRGGVEWTAQVVGDGMVFADNDVRWELPLPALAGAHQVANAGAAIAALRAGGFALTREQAAAGLLSARWPGRLQRLADIAPGCELWVDGAHNEHGARALAAQLALWRDKPVHLVFGLMQRKDAAAFLRPLLPYVATVTAVPISGEPLAHTSETLAAALAGSGIGPVDFADGLEAAVRAAPGQGGRVVVAGSLYLAGQALARWGESPEIH